ncbi:hypothetical protein D3C85_1042170 [compost metagenome]
MYNRGEQVFTILFGYEIEYSFFRDPDIGNSADHNSRAAGFCYKGNQICSCGCFTGSNQFTKLLLILYPRLNRDIDIFREHFSRSGSGKTIVILRTLCRRGTGLVDIIVV